MALAADAFADVNTADEQLIGFFIDGLQYDYMKMKVMRDNPATLQNAIQVANQEQNLRRRFDLRSGHKPQAAQYANDEPMDISHARHKAKDCRAHRAVKIHQTFPMEKRMERS